MLDDVHAFWENAVSTHTNDAFFRLRKILIFKTQLRRHGVVFLALTITQETVYFFSGQFHQIDPSVMPFLSYKLITFEPKGLSYERVNT